MSRVSPCVPMTYPHPDTHKKLSSASNTQVCLTGHSLGGSVASILMLMLVHRGDASADRMAPCLTFGAPAVFCEHQHLERQHATDELASSDETEGGRLRLPGEEGAASVPPQQCALQRLGLSTNQLINVMMNMDMIPRFFAHDFTPMVGLMVGLMIRRHEARQEAYIKDKKLLLLFAGPLALSLGVARLLTIHSALHRPAPSSNLCHP